MISVLQMITQLEGRLVKAQETALDCQKKVISSENNVHNNILVYYENASLLHFHSFHYFGFISIFQQFGFILSI